MPVVRTLDGGRPEIRAAFIWILPLFIALFHSGGTMSENRTVPNVGGRHGGSVGDVMGDAGPWQSSQVLSDIRGGPGRTVERGDSGE